MAETTVDFVLRVTAEVVPRDSSPPFTPADYKTDEPLHNARVFLAVTNDTLWAVNPWGIFYESARSDCPGTATLWMLRDKIKETDVFSKLDVADREEAAAMLFHLLPTAHPGEH